MNTSPTILKSPEERAARLSKIIHDKANRHTFQRDFWGWVTSILYGAAVLCSAAAGIAGIAKRLDVQVVGVLAVIPTLIAFIGPRFQCREWVQWNADFATGLRKLNRELTDQLPLNPTVNNIAAVSRRYTDFVDQMEKRKSETFRQAWDFSGPKPKTERS